MRRQDFSAALGILIAASLIGVFIDWLLFARGERIARGTSMLDFAGWLVSKEDRAGITATLRLALAGAASASAALAVAIFYRARSNAAARQVAWLMVAYAAFTFSSGFLAVDSRYSAGKTFHVLSADLAFSLVALMALAFARFLLIFPRPVDFDSIARQRWFGPVRRQAADGMSTFARWGGSVRARSVVMAACHRMLVDGRLLLIGPAAVFVLLAAVPVMNDVLPSVLWGGVAATAIAAATILFIFGIFPMAMASTGHLRRNGTDEERRRVSWLRAMLMVGVVVILLVVFGPMVVRWAGSEGAATDALWGAQLLGFLMLPTAFTFGLAFAVLYGGALDPRIAFTRVTLWTVLGVAVTAAFIVIERFVALKAVELLGLPKETGLVVAGGAIAASFMPIQRAAQRTITRLADRYLPISVVAEGRRVTRTVGITDLSGYTALANRDEPVALMQGALLKRQAGRLVSNHGGRVVKSMGDAVMLSFTEADGAVACIAELHEAFPRAAEAVGLDPLALHSSLHSGEIVESHDGDIYGHSVNLCARLVDAAAAGEVVVSGAVMDLLTERGGIVSAGQRRFKNVAEPVDCYRVDLSARQIPAVPDAVPAHA